MTDKTQLPSSNTLSSASNIAIQEDKPILLDYWIPSVEKKAFIGIKIDNDDPENKTFDKLLVKSEDEYTSSISKIFKSSNEYIVITENSIYIVHSSISTKKISM